VGKRNVLLGSAVAYNTVSNIPNRGSAILQIENSTILTPEGYGLWVVGGTVEVLNTTFSGMNQAQPGQGGAPRYRRGWVATIVRAVGPSYAQLSFAGDQRRSEGGWTSPYTSAPGDVQSSL
jgi:hypothetical protein